MKRTLMTLALLVATATGCSPEALGWWWTAERDDQQAVSEHILRSAADEFGADPDLIVRIARCESGLRPWAYNQSGAAGLMQHMSQFWPGRAAALGIPDASVFDPVANARVGAWMLAADPSASAWAESKKCWGR